MEQENQEEAARLKAMLRNPAAMEQIRKQVEPMKITKGQLPVPEGTTEVSSERRPLKKSAGLMKFELATVPVKWFSLAAVYHICRIDFSLMEEFVNSPLGKDAEIYTYAIPFKVMPDIPNWENVIEGIEPSHWDNLVQFTAQLGFYRGEVKPENIVTLHGVTLTIPDRQYNSKFELNVFAPNGPKFALMPFVDESGCVRFSAEQKGELS